MSNEDKIKGNERKIVQAIGGGCCCSLPMAKPHRDTHAKLKHDTTGWYKIDLRTLLGRF